MEISKLIKNLERMDAFVKSEQFEEVVKLLESEAGIFLSNIKFNKNFEFTFDFKIKETRLNNTYGLTALKHAMRLRDDLMLRPMANKYYFYRELSSANGKVLPNHDVMLTSKAWDKNYYVNELFVEELNKAFDKVKGYDRVWLGVFFYSFFIKNALCGMFSAIGNYYKKF